MVIVSLSFWQCGGNLLKRRQRGMTIWRQAAERLAFFPEHKPGRHMAAYPWHETTLSLLQLSDDGFRFFSTSAAWQTYTSAWCLANKTGGKHGARICFPPHLMGVPSSRITSWSIWVWRLRDPVIIFIISQRREHIQTGGVNQGVTSRHSGAWRALGAV